MRYIFVIFWLWFDQYICWCVYAISVTISIALNTRSKQSPKAFNGPRLLTWFDFNISTDFWWRHHGPVTSQLADPIKWSIYPLELIGIYVHINTHSKESLTEDVGDRHMYNYVWYFCTYPYGLSLNGWHALLCIANNRHGVTITTHGIKRDYLIWMTTVRQPTKCWRSCVLTLKYTFLCLLVNETKSPQHLDCGKSIPATHGG